MATPPDNRLKCSFCGKSQDQVIKLIAGPGTYICNECVDLCNEIMSEEEEEKSLSGQKQVGSTKVLSAFAGITSNLQTTRIPLDKRITAADAAAPEYRESAIQSLQSLLENYGYSHADENTETLICSLLMLLELKHGSNSKELLPFITELYRYYVSKGLYKQAIQMAEWQLEIEDHSETPDPEVRLKLLLELIDHMMSVGDSRQASLVFTKIQAEFGKICEIARKYES